MFTVELQAVIQLDGVNDSSSEDEDEDGDGQDDDAEENDPTLQEEAEEVRLTSSRHDRGCIMITTRDKCWVK